MAEDDGINWEEWNFETGTSDSDFLDNWMRQASTLKMQEEEDYKQMISLYEELDLETGNSQIKVDSPLECSPVLASQEKVTTEKNVLHDSSIEDISIFLIDKCNQAVPKLRLGLSAVQEEMKSVTSDLEHLDSDSLILVMEKSWQKLYSDVGKMCMCVPFSSTTDLCQRLCKNLLLPWLKNGLPTRLEQLSEILSVQGETVCRHLVVPLLQTEDSPLVQDPLNLEELMTSMSAETWTVMLKYILSDLKELQKWHVPMLATLFDHAQPSSDELFVIVQHMSLSGSTYDQDRDFGTLLVAVANCLKAGSSALASQLKLVANNHKGPMKFKALKILADVKD